MRRTTPWPSIVFGLVLATVVPGCDRSDEDSSEPSATKDEPGKIAESPPEATPPPEAPSVRGVPAGALDVAIRAPADGGSTYYVDAFVPAMALHELRAGSSGLTLQRVELETATGYKVSGAGPGSLYHRLGLRDGDVVEAINGVAIDGVEAAERSVRGAQNRVTVTLFREDVSFTLAYRLVGAMAWSQVLAQAEPDAGSPPAADPQAFAAVVEPEGGGGEVDGGDVGDDVPDPLTTPKAGGETPSRGGGRATPAVPPPSRGGGPSSGGGGRGGGGGGGARGGGGGGSNSAAACSSASQCTIPKRRFDALTASPSKLQSQARIVPAIRNDIHSGYKLNSIRGGSDLAKLGFRSGDKVTHVNGFDLTDDAQAMQLYLQLGSMRSFKVRYERGGRARTKTIRVV